MQIRYIIITALIASVIHANKHESIEDIPAIDQETYRKCVVQLAIEKIKMDIKKTPPHQAGEKKQDGATSHNLSSVQSSDLYHALKILYMYRSKNYASAIHPHVTCPGLFLLKDEKNFITWFFSNDDKNYGYYSATERSVKQRANKIAEKLKQQRALLPKTAEELQYNFDNVSSEEMDNLPNTLKQNLRDIQELANERINADEAEETDNADNA